MLPGDPITKHKNVSVKKASRQKLRVMGERKDKESGIGLGTLNAPKCIINNFLSHGDF